LLNLDRNNLLGKKAAIPSQISEEPLFEMVVHIGKDPVAMGASDDKLTYLDKYWKFNSDSLCHKRPKELEVLKLFHEENQDKGTYTLTKF
jgi:hypothetical protein